MGSSKKRKSHPNGNTPVSAGKAPKHDKTEEAYPKWTNYGGYTTVQMQANQSVILLGQAVLQVLHGVVDVCGKTETPQNPPLNLSTGGRQGLAIRIAAVSTSPQVPRLSDELIEFSLQVPPLVFQDDQPVTFSLYKEDDPSAPGSLVVTPQWQEAISSITQATTSQAPISVVVCGGKNVGKSSLCRLIINQLLNSHPCVAFMDTDCGQPELTAPGLVSLTLLMQPLIGPPHVHSQPSHLAHFVGDTSPQNDPERYLAALQSLLKQHQYANPPNIPLVINTQGWVKGLGYELLTQLLQSVSPSHLVQVRHGPDKKNLPREPFWSNGSPCHTSILCVDSFDHGNTSTAASGNAVSSNAANVGSMGSPGTTKHHKAIDDRNLQWHAWAKMLLGWDPCWGSYESDDLWQTAQALAALPPWVMPLDAVKVDFLYNSVPADQIGYALNGMLVGLVIADLGSSTAPAVPAAQPVTATACPHDGRVGATDQSSNSHQDLSLVSSCSTWDVQLKPSACRPGRCVGIGLVRAVDMAKRQLYILTSLPDEVMQQVDALEVGRLELPNALLHAGDIVSPYLALFSLDKEATGAGGGGARRNVGRASLVETM